jgi:hypothetical protein
LGPVTVGKPLVPMLRTNRPFVGFPEAGRAREDWKSRAQAAETVPEGEAVKQRPKDSDYGPSSNGFGP